jgi:hypothetical protein
MHNKCEYKEINIQELRENEIVKRGTYRHLFYINVEATSQFSVYCDVTNPL